MDRIYFIAAAKSPAADLLRSYHTSCVKQRAWVRTFAKQHGLQDCGWIGNGDNLIGFAPEKPQTWVEFLAKHPDWRRQTARRGTDYAVPRRKTPEQRALSKAWWEGKPKLVSTDHIKTKLAGVDDFLGWMVGHINYGLAWTRQKNGDYIVALPYFILKHKDFKLLTGCTRAEDQDAARDELAKV